MRRGLLLSFLLLGVGTPFVITEAAGAQDAFAAKIKPFLAAHCTDCHGAETKKAGLRLDELKPDFRDARTTAHWISVHDKLVSGEMPPKKRKRPAKQELETVTHWLRTSLHAASFDRQQKDGRVVFRRLNGTEYETTLQDLLASRVEVKDMLPEDNVAAGFDNVSAVLDVSPDHLFRYQEAAEKAILSVIPNRPPSKINQRVTGRQITEKNANNFKGYLGRTCKVKEDSLVLYAPLASHLMAATAPAPQPGRYRVQISAYAIGTAGKPLPVSLVVRDWYGRDDKDLRDCRDVPADKATILEGEFELTTRKVVVISGWTLPGERELGKKAAGENYPGPGLVVEWLKIEGPLDPWPPEGYQRLFAGVPLKAKSVAAAEAQGQVPPKIPDPRPEGGWIYDPLVIASAKPKEDADRLIRAFLPRAFRRPVDEATQKYYVKLVHDRLDKKIAFPDAMIYGYKAILCSPHFLFFTEPGSHELTDKKEFRSTKLDDYAVANRLAYFLWSSLPDPELMKVAGQKGELTKPATLRAQVERMLKDSKARRFTQHFTGQWLELRKIDATVPEPQFYPEYDHFLFWSMPRETEMFFDEVLANDLSVAEFVHSDWSFLNRRLAQHYGIAGVEGSPLRKVKLPLDCHRGGVITQASILKITADGTRTSPVLRGRWVLERIVGKPPAPPPPDIGSIEPDIRGATTIRQQLDKHRNTAACASCHIHIDPPGFALESFDVIGGWRDFYRASKPTKQGMVELPNYPGRKVFRGLDVEKGGETPDGRAFKDIDDYKKILLEDKDQLARNLTRQLLIYATGADIQFADREVVEQIVATARAKNYGFRTMLHEVVQSRVFLSK